MSTSTRYSIKNSSADGSQRANDSHLNRDIVLKPWWPATERDHLRALIATLANIQSKHVADVYDLIDMSGGIVAVVEEHLEGKSLSEWEAGTPSGEPEVLRVLLQMVGAVKALHSYQLSPPSLNTANWRFDAEGLLNLSLFCPPTSGQTRPGEPIKLTEDSAAADLLALAQHARRFAVQHLSKHGSEPPVLTDPVLQHLLNGAPTATSTAAMFYQRLNAYLLRDQHRAVVIYRNRSAELNSTRRTLKLTHPTPSIAETTIHYDGTGFAVIASTGEVYLNNIRVVAPTPMPGSCVLTLGAPIRSWSERHFITFDASHPEVVF
ncbi:protein kinase [Melittangium boletus DSM 14713]|uniref:Protein kinase n=1 Tax=Melittangium boletus DSM 14713 TaxID=1294270 RepID=A0A250IBU9_9BACT|nr:protein kinase [Melittangium boletus DSM 14713]